MRRSIDELPRLSELPLDFVLPDLPPGNPRNRRWLSGLHLLGLLFGLIGPLRMLPSHWFGQGHRQGSLSACKSNCKNIATALEMYASDNCGAYPRSLQQLTVGNYLTFVPTCPAAGELTYTNYRVSRNPDKFSFGCAGNHHARAYTGYAAPSQGFPRYHSEMGLIEHP